MKPSLLISLLALALAGCSDYATTRALNKGTLSGPGDYMGTLPDGCEVHRYRIDNGSMSHDHWVYVTGRDVTINHDERSGKTTHNEVEAVLSRP